MFADFYFRAAGFCSRFFHGYFSLFLWQEVPRKILQEDPGQNPAKFVLENPRHIWGRVNKLRTESSLSLRGFRPSFCLSFPASPVPCRPWMGNVKITGNRKKILTRRGPDLRPEVPATEAGNLKIVPKGVFAHVGQKPVALVQNRVGCIGARDSWETPFSSWPKHLLRPLLTTLGNLEVSGLCSRHSGSQV